MSRGLTPKRAELELDCVERLGADEGRVFVRCGQGPPAAFKA